ncbi:citrate/2-methylcitrate synthase [Actinoallomurus sp. CA-150999]|uniref:citrate/2-methylcitrate synthase n=1 Tax=Actinoallomurus sp. CA-150999 TaxID=3239887 RepID=UPI003D8FFD0B
MEETAGEWIDAARAAERLGVKPATLYAYVSRGVLRRRRAPDGRRSLFDPAEIEELARRGRPRRPPGASELVIESRVTALGDDRPYYRGRDALTLAGSDDFEAVAEWLWAAEPSSARDDASRPSPQAGGDASLSGPQAGGDAWQSGPQAGGDASLSGPQAGRDAWQPSPQAGGDAWQPSSQVGGDAWRASPQAVAVARAAQSGLPGETLPLDRLQVITTALAAADPVRLVFDAPAVVALGRRLIAGMVESLPAARGEADPPDGASIAARLWTRLTPQEPRPAAVRALNAALVLLADHELAASALAARVAASVRADPYAVVTAGLGAAGGGLHGGASLGAEALLAEISTPERAARVIGERLRRGEGVPGFGHRVYRLRDGRAGCLFGLVRDAAPGHERLAAAEAVLAEARGRGLPGVNVDFALATLGAVTGMGRGAGEAIFAVARTAGWLAHALEEYARGTPLRPRAIYTGRPRAM